MNTFPLLLEIEDFLSYLNQSQGNIDCPIRIIDLSRESIHQQIHIANAIPLSAKKLVRQFDEATGLLPLEHDLQALMLELNISPHHWVIVYDDEGGGWASRLMWTLHCVGFHRVSVLNGGIHACLANGVALTSQSTHLVASEQIYQVDCSQIQHYRIEYDELLQKVHQQNTQLWDCRSLEEFNGEKRMARRAGHIPHAIHFDWLNLFDKNNHFKMKSLNTIATQLEQKGLNLSQPLIVYCQSHHRSSLAYLVARLLNCSVRAYDGAWSEWGNQSHSLIELGS